MRAVGGFCCAAGWLALLVASAFSTVVVSVGLLAVLYVLNDSTGESGRARPGKTSASAAIVAGDADTTEL